MDASLLSESSETNTSESSETNTALDNDAFLEALDVRLYDGESIRRCP